MKFSSKVLKCGLSPMRKFHPYAVAAEARGKKIYHLNIGQPDIETPKAYFEAVRHFDLPVLAYAPSPGIPELIAAIQKYYDDLDMHFETGDILITNGGSEALQIAMNCILDDGDEILIPEPFYPNYNTMAYTCGAKIHPIPTSPHDGYHYADRAKVEAEINEHTRAIMVTNPGNPTGAVLTPEEMRMMVDIAKEHDLFIIGDEAYREFVYAGEPLQSMGQFDDAAENVIVIDTVSKRFSACGARIGCMISRNKELMAQAMKYAQCRLSVPTIDQVAAAALYRREGCDSLVAVGGGLHGGRRRVRPDIGEQDIALQLRQHLPEGGIGALAAAGRHQRAADAVLRQQGRDAGKAAGADHRLRPAPRQQPGARAENALVGTIPEMEQIQEKASLRFLYYGG